MFYIMDLRDMKEKEIIKSIWVRFIFDGSKQICFAKARICSQKYLLLQIGAWYRRSDIEILFTAPH